MLEAVVKIHVLIGPSEVNKYIECGWKIIHIYNSDIDRNHYSHRDRQTPHFIMGWMNAEPIYPEPEKDENPFL